MQSGDAVRGCSQGVHLGDAVRGGSLYTNVQQQSSGQRHDSLLIMRNMLEWCLLSATPVPESSGPAHLVQLT